nr:hypothetical protein Iba_chr13aCG7910 [Ipomoea batatas]
MSDNLRLAHLQSLGHPVEEGKVSLEIEVNKFGNKVASSAGASPPSKNVPFGKVLSSLCSFANCELRRRQRREEPKRQSATSEAPTSDGDPASPVLSVSVAASSELRSTVLSVVYWEITVIIIDESDLMIYGVSRE